MSKWSRTDIGVTAVVSLLSIGVVILTWVGTELPSKLNFTLWVVIALGWLFNTMVAKYSKEKK
jgi:hypothetical protein